MDFIPNTDRNREAMLRAIGVGSLEELFADIPPEARLDRPLRLPEPMAELELQQHMLELADRNAHLGHLVCFAGAGIYDHYIPAVVDHVISRSEFYTAYTPYQPEVSQAVLQSIFEYQTMICELTGMDVSQASHYDGATALAEAGLISCSTTGRRHMVVSSTVHPEYRRVLHTYAAGADLKVTEVPYRDGVTDLEALERALAPGAEGGEPACLLVQHPNFFGCLEPVADMAQLIHGRGGLFVVAASPISLGLLTPPGAYGADMAVGEGQALGNVPSFGGPTFGYFAVTEKLVRRLPGRVVGQTVDSRGQRGFVLTLQTREQHIRREKATSNICSNEALNALAATVYLATLGKRGIREVAELCLKKAHYARDAIAALPGFSPAFGAPFFMEFAVRCPCPPAELVKRGTAKGMLPGVALGRFYPELDDCLLVAVTEKRSRVQIDALAKVLEGCA
ncbi:MAG: aminomethyl-transferring glycine dehydrogenase subunit GcvPA [Bacillota bacterium]|nr:aminomethyl-transferring glycine dehydrogenase subunit GcvPA [Bacillota bacterium]